MATPKTAVICSSCGAKKCNIFCDLAPELVGELNQIKKSHFYKKKQILCYEGNPATGIYCIESGRVKVFKTSPDGKQYINFLATTGDVLGMEGILLHDDYVATAEMLTDGIACYIEKQELMNILQRDFKTAYHLLEYLARRLKQADEERLELAQGAVRERFARLLAYLARHYGNETPQGIEVELPLSREEMAEMIGSAAETAMRLLKEFREEELLMVKGRQLTVLNADRLDRVAGL